MKTSLTLSLLVLTGFAVTGCGKSDKAAAPAPTSPAPASSTATASADSNIRTVEITGDDQMKFSVTSIKAKAGEKLRVSLKNVGKLPKQAMAHNWVLLKSMSDADVNAFAMAAMPKAPEYLPADKSGIVAHTKLLGPGEADAVEFTVPAAGEYPFICTFPGHSALMRGKLVAE
jgi:azurin